MIPSDEISEDRREALRYSLGIGTGAALTSALISPASAQGAADNTLARIRADKPSVNIAVDVGSANEAVIAKKPNLGTYKILQSPAVTISSSMAVRRESDKRWRAFLSVWVDYNRGVGQMREWFVKGLGLSGVKPEDVPMELNV